MVVSKGSVPVDCATDAAGLLACLRHQLLAGNFGQVVHLRGSAAGARMKCDRWTQWPSHPASLPGLPLWAPRVGPVVPLTSAASRRRVAFAEATTWGSVLSRDRRWLQHGRNRAGACK